MLAAQASAGIITYTARSAFLQALQGLYQDEGFEPNSYFSASGPKEFTGYTRLPTGEIVNVDFAFIAAARNGLYLGNGVPFGIGVDQFLITTVPGESILITPSRGHPNAFGTDFFFEDWLNGITITNGQDPPLITNDAAPLGPAAFFGFISTNGPLPSILFERTAGSGYVGPDNIVQGAAGIPEPGTAALLGAGLMAICFFGRPERKTR